VKYRSASTPLKGSFFVNLGLPTTINMKLSLIVTAALAASIKAAVLEKRQWGGYPDGKP
jgi:hypothetical protein